MPSLCKFGILGTNVSFRFGAYLLLQIHVPIVGFDSSKKLVVVSNVDEDLGVPLDGLPQYAERTRL